MKLIAFFLLCFALCLSSCDNKTDKQLQEKYIELQKQHVLKQQHIATLSVLVYDMAKNLNHFDHSGIWNFFDAPEFWENTYDVNPAAGCYRQCSRNYALTNSNCQKITDSVQRLACVNEAYKNLVKCTQACR